ncbi:hypothetical protein [Streptomyces sp. NPDC056056]|uniref:hypothetical protein n=1 Tax=Streptomyces sp. NPDC056056 TaxID=3345698 RepID=UPI0035DED92E
MDENLLARKVAEHVANLPAEANGTGKGAQVHGPAGARAVDDAPTMPLGRSLKDARDRAHQDGMVSGDSQAAGHDADDEGRRRRDR